MRFLALTWLEFACPLGWFGQRAIPPAARPFVCTARPQYVLLDRLAEAEQRIRALGPEARPALYRHVGFRRSEVPIHWHLTLEVGP